MVIGCDVGGGVVSWRVHLELCRKSSSGSEIRIKISLRGALLYRRGRGSKHSRVALEVGGFKG